MYRTIGISTGTTRGYTQAICCRKERRVGHRDGVGAASAEQTHRKGPLKRVRERIDYELVVCSVFSA